MMPAHDRGRAAARPPGPTGRRWALAVHALIALLIVACGAAPATGTAPIAAVSPTTTPVPTVGGVVSRPTPATPVATPGRGAASPAGASLRTIPWRGGNWYLLGVNYPYHRYGNDFGGNAWGSYGVHDPGTYAAVDADFASMAALGVRTVRWFVFADGRAGITYDAVGLPTGLDDAVFRDFDAALEIAQRHNIGINFVLLDFRFLWDARIENGVQLGGRAGILATPAGQEALVQNVFAPVFRRYAAHPAILSWEVMNEPEWALLDAGHVTAEVSRPVTLATFRAFARLVVGAIHEQARSYATIGCADAKWARNWTGLGLDYYQVHFYDWMKPYSTDNLFAMRAESLGLDRPVVVGEFPAAHSTVADLRAYLDTWYNLGYAGAWPWSFRADAVWGAPDHGALRAWAEAHREVIAIPPAR
jgi:hypothetical protein